MRALLAALALAASPTPSITNAGGPPVQIAQMARDVTDAVRKQRAQRRARPRDDRQPDQETRR